MATEIKKHVLLTQQANEFVYSQPLPVIGELLALFSELEKHGRLERPRAEKVEGRDNLFEIRVKVAPNQYRAFYCYATEDKIFILSGFIKKTQKTPVQEIRKALKIRKELGI